MWNRNEKTITCLACAPSSGDPESGEAGASAASEGQRRRDKRLEEVRRKHGDHAAAVAEAMAERDHAASWGKGSEGESRLAAFLTREVGDAVIPLHDRLIPGTRGNIDHIASTGVWIVDADWRLDLALFSRDRLGRVSKSARQEPPEERSTLTGEHAAGRSAARPELASRRELTPRERRPSRP